MSRELLRRWGQEQEVRWSSNYACPLFVWSIVNTSALNGRQEVRCNVKRSGVGLVCKRLPFLVNHCTCRSSAFVTRVVYLPTQVCVSSDLRPAKTICQSGTPSTHTLALRAGMANPCARLPLRVDLKARAPEPFGHSFRRSARLA